MKRVPLSVILMVYNEEDSIEKDIQNYYHTITKKFSNSELIIAEDGSTDNTREIIKKLSKTIPLIDLTSAQKREYAASLRLALKKASGELVFYADAGGKHDARDFWKLYEKTKKYDLVSGYKKNRKDPWYRLFLAWGLNTSVNIYFGVKFRDIDSGFKLMKKDVRDRIVEENFVLRDNISLEVTLKAVYLGFNIIEVPIHHFKRKFGSSRGLPLQKIPKVVARLLFAYPRLKQSLKNSHL